MVDLQGKNQRGLSNRLSDLRVKLAETKSDLQKISRHKAEHELIVRRIKKEIQRKEMELDKLQLVSKKFEKDEFELNNNERLLKKQLQAVMTEQRIMKDD